MSNAKVSIPSMPVEKNFLKRVNRYLANKMEKFVYKDIIKELENTDLLQYLILDKFIDKHGGSTFFSKRSNFFCLMVLETFAFYFAQN